MMPRFPAPWLAVPVAVGVAVAVFAAHPADGRTTDPTADDPMPVLADTTEQDRQLTARQQQMQDRIAYKEALITELVEGRTTLAVVAAEFLRLNLELQTTLETVRSMFPGSSDEEKHAYNVIHFVRVRSLPDGKKARVLSRLHQEFEARYGHSAFDIP